MSLPSTKLTQVDGSSGLSAGESINACVHVGVCSSGTVNTVYAFADHTLLRSSMGDGPAVEACALDIAVNGIGLICRVTASAGSTPTLTQSGSGPAITVTGTPLDDYDLILKCIDGGLRGVSTHQLSIDGGDTWSDLFSSSATVSTFASKTGLTFAFASGTYVANETYSATCAAPTYTSGNLVLAVQAACNSSYKFRYINVVGQASSVANHATLTATVSAALEAFEVAGTRYVQAIMNAPYDTDANLISGMLGVLAPRAVNVADGVDIISPIDSSIRKRPANFAFAPWVASHPIHHHPGLRADNAIFGFVTKTYRDERLTPGLYDARFSTVQTDPGEAGFFFSGGKTLAAVGSDYAEIQSRAVMDRACEYARAYLRRLQNDHRFETDKTTKCLTEKQASSLDDDLRSELVGSIVAPGYAQDVDVRFSRTEQSKLTKQIKVKITVDELLYGNTISAEIGFYGNGSLFKG